MFPVTALAEKRVEDYFIFFLSSFGVAEKKKKIIL